MVMCVLGGGIVLTAIVSEPNCIRMMPGMSEVLAVSTAGLMMLQSFLAVLCRRCSDYFARGQSNTSHQVGSHQGEYCTQSNQ